MLAYAAMTDRRAGDSLTDVPGFRVGHATDARGLTGCTVILCGDGAVPGCDVIGRATGLRDPGPCEPDHLVPAIHALFLSGGSAYGLDATAGVMSYLEERRVGFRLREAVVPIVPAAILFDLSVGDRRARPGPSMARRACRAASPKTVRQGNVGAGTGATVGKMRGIARAMKSGLGSASTRRGDLVAGALVVVNAWGDVVDPGTGRVVAGLRDSPRGRRRIGTAASLRDSPETRPKGSGRVPTSTTLGVIATNARLTKVETCAVARLARAAYARCISPVGTRYDGDVIFCLSRGTVRADSLVVGMLAIEVMQTAILRAATRARGLPGLPAAGDLDPD